MTVGQTKLSLCFETGGAVLSAPTQPHLMKPHKTKAAALWLLLLLLLWMVGIYFWRHSGGVLAEAGAYGDRLTLRAEGTEDAGFRSEPAPSQRRRKTEAEESVSTPRAPVAEGETEVETAAKLDREMGGNGSDPPPARLGLKVATVSFGRLYDGYGKVFEAKERWKSEGQKTRTSAPNTLDVIELYVFEFDREVMADIREAVARIARAEELDFVFDTSGRSLTGVNDKGKIVFGLNPSGRVTTDYGILLYAEGSLDLTAKVLEELNREAAAEVRPVIAR